MPPRRFCIFCHRPANSREHLLPDWLGEILPADEKVIHTRQVGGEGQQKWTRKPFEERTKQVCAECNHGWMSRLEEAAKPVLAPMVTRSRIPYELDPRARWIAATWAAKTSYVFESQSSHSLVPSIHPFLTMENGMPPAQVNIFIGSHDRARRDPINSFFLAQPLSAAMTEERSGDQAEFGYMAFSAIAGVSFLVIGHRHTGRLRFNLNPPSSELLSKLWPPEGNSLSWPPPMLMDRELLSLVFDQESRPAQLEISLAEDEFPPRPRGHGDAGTLRDSASSGPEAASS
jgi:hypothetical protein